MFLINTKSDMDDSTTNIRRCTRRRRNSIRQAVPLLGIILLATTAFLVIAGNVEAKDPPRGGQTPLVLNPIQAFVATISDAKSHLVAAAVARSSALLCCYPIDTVKTRIQTAHPLPFTMNGLYGGIGSCLFGQVPCTALTFGSYELWKKKLTKDCPQLPQFVVHSLAAVMGDLTGSIWLCPGELVKQNLQAGTFTSRGEAIAHIWKTTGPRGFYRGYGSTVGRDVPFRVAQLTTYEFLKGLYIRDKSSRQFKREGSRSMQDMDISSSEAAVIGGVAGGVATVVTQPMDRIRTLLMTQGNLYGGNMIACARTVVRNDGIGGLYSGIVPRVGYIVPSVAIFFIAYEFTQQNLRHW